MFKRIEVSANIPINSTDKIYAACQLLESFKPDDPVTVKKFNGNCVIVSARYSWLKALKLKHYVRDGKKFINGFNVILGG